MGHEILGSFVIFALCGATLCQAAAPPSPPKIISPKEPLKFTEAQGQLRIQMREDAGTTPFVYPCLWEAEHYRTPKTPPDETASGIIQYWAHQTQKDFIRSIKVVVMKDGDPVWDSSLGLTGTGSSSLKPTDAEKWDDSGFRTRTNVRYSVDADGVRNEINGRFKFLDPAKSPYQAVLVMDTIEGTKVSQPVPFQARKRSVFLASNDLDDDDRAAAKAQMWKVYDVKEGDKYDAGTSGNDDEPRLWLSFTKDSKPTFAEAYGCVTPQSTGYSMGHGDISGGHIVLDGTRYPGFRGLGPGFGTWAVRYVGEPIAKDLSDVAQVHDVMFWLIHCCSGHYPNRHIDPEEIPEAKPCSVAQSYANALRGTSAAGGSVVGFDSDVYGLLGVFKAHYDRLECGAGLTAQEKLEIMEGNKSLHQDPLASLAVFDVASKMKPAPCDSTGQATTVWVLNITPDRFGIGFADNVVLGALRRLFDAKHPGHGPYTITVSGSRMDYEPQTATLKKAKDKGAASADQNLPIPVPRD